MKDVQRNNSSTSIGGEVGQSSNRIEMDLAGEGEGQGVELLL